MRASTSVMARHRACYPNMMKRKKFSNFLENDLGLMKKRRSR
jgi:hypothetical protein